MHATPSEFDHWPLFGLEVRMPDMTLRYPDDDLLVELLRVAARGVHDPATMPFLTPWTRHESPQLEREALRFHWQCRVDTRPGKFRIPLVAIVDDEVIGASELNADDFMTLRQVETGSWLGLEHHRKGYGTQMRLGSLALGFDGLDALLAVTTAWHDNAASLGVTRSLGYTEAGHHRTAREGVAETELRFEMTRDQFDTVRPSDVEFAGLDAVQAFLEL